MNTIKLDDRLILKSSTDKSFKHSCIEYCVEKREKCSNTELLVIAISLAIAVYLYLISASVMCLEMVFIFFVLFVLILRFSFKIHNESLLITAPIGLQMTTTYITGHQSVFTLPWQSITDILIVDGIQTQKVLYYLAIKTPQNRLVTLFQNSAPRLHFLEIIYKDVYKLLENSR